MKFDDHLHLHTELKSLSIIPCDCA